MRRRWTNQNVKKDSITVSDDFLNIHTDDYAQIRTRDQDCTSFCSESKLSDVRKREQRIQCYSACSSDT
jgi:hypothetical protein